MVFCYRCLSRQRKGKRQKDSEREREVKELTQAIISLARLKYVVQASRLDRAAPMRQGLQAREVGLGPTCPSLQEAVGSTAWLIRLRAA